MNSKPLDYTALAIAVIGAVNWGLIGFFRFNLVSFLFGDMTPALPHRLWDRGDLRPVSFKLLRPRGQAWRMNINSGRGVHVPNCILTHTM